MKVLLKDGFRLALEGHSLAENSELSTDFIDMHDTSVKARILAHPQKQKILIVIGEMDDLMRENFQNILYEVLGDLEQLEIVATSDGDVLLELAQHRKVNLFIIMANNVLFPSRNLPSTLRFEQVLTLISTLKSTYDTPIVSSSGIEELVPKVLDAGADFSFGRPFSVEKFSQAVKRCLGLENKSV